MLQTLLSTANIGAKPLFLLVAPIALLIYVFAVWDTHSRQAKGQSGDPQIGFKVALATFALLGLIMLLVNLQLFLTYLLTLRFRSILRPLPGVLVGGAVFYVIAQRVLPRTNSDEQPKVFRLTVGVITILAGIALIMFTNSMLEALVSWRSWEYFAYQLAGVIIYVPFALFGVMYLARQMGVEAVASDIQTMAQKVRLPKKMTSQDSTPPTTTTATPSSSTPSPATPSSSAPSSAMPSSSTGGAASKPLTPSSSSTSTQPPAKASTPPAPSATSGPTTPSAPSSTSSTPIPSGAIKLSSTEESRGSSATPPPSTSDKTSSSSESDKTPPPDSKGSQEK